MYIICIFPHKHTCVVVRECKLHMYTKYKYSHHGKAFVGKKKSRTSSKQNLGFK